MSDVVVTDSASPISFQTEGGGDWKVWDRYIAIDGQRAFHIGNVCGTCQFFFERLDGANQSVNPETVASELNAGVTNVEGDLLDALKKIMPDGRYRPCLLGAAPMLVSPGDPEDYFATEQIALWGREGFEAPPHDPRTDYYRLGSRRLSDGRALHEFLVPTFPRSCLKHEDVDAYSAALKGGARPTAVALSVLDVKQPAVGQGELEVTSHWCLAHYLLDGHHKVFAASQVGMPCSLLSFLAMEQGISSPEQVAELLRILAMGA